MPSVTFYLNISHYELNNRMDVSRILNFVPFQSNYCACKFEIEMKIPMKLLELLYKVYNTSCFHYESVLHIFHGVDMNSILTMVSGTYLAMWL